MKVTGSVILLSALFVCPAFAESNVDSLENASSTSQAHFDWSGAYVGGFLGAASGGNVPNPEVGLLMNGGLWNRGSPAVYPDIPPDSKSIDRFNGGFTIGYNWQLNQSSNWLPNLVGIEAEVGSIGLHTAKKITDFTSGNTPDQAGLLGEGRNGYTNSIGPLYKFIGLRIGYAVDYSLFYLKGGYAFTESVSTFETQNAGTFEESKSSEKNPAFAMGYEYALPKVGSQQWTVKAEYLFIDLKTKEVIEYNNPAECIPPTCWPFISPTLPGGVRFDYKPLQTIKIGINLKF